MTTISNANSTALLILQQANPVEATKQQQPGADNLEAVANGVGGKIAVSQQPGQAESKISEAMFSVNTVSANKLKLDLIDRAGKALGVDQSDYASKDEFVSAMQGALTKIKTQENGPQAIAAIEKDLGLDKLGVSLEDVVASARDPEREDNLTRALEKQAGKTKDAEKDGSEPQFFRPSELGLYAATPV